MATNYQHDDIVPVLTWLIFVVKTCSFKKILTEEVEFSPAIIRNVINRSSGVYFYGGCLPGLGGIGFGKIKSVSTN